MNRLCRNWKSPVVCCILLLTFVCAAVCFAQAPDTLWTKTYGGTSRDQGKSVRQTQDGGYIVAGYKTSNPGLMDFYLIKTDSLGDTLWTRTYGGNGEDLARCVQQTHDGGYIITGYEESFRERAHRVYLVKTDSSGDTLWTKTYFGGNAWSVEQTSDSGYIVGGSSSNHVFLLKTDTYGNTLWMRQYGTNRPSHGYCARQTSDGGYIIGGVYTGQTDDFYFVKTDSIGDTLWTTIFGGSEYDCCYSIQQITDGGYIAVGGYNMLYRYGADVCLMKLDISGTLDWYRLIGGNNDDVGYSVQQTSDGGYIIAGRTFSFGPGGFDLYVVKTDRNGDILWSDAYGTVGDEWAFDVQETSDKGYIVTGWICGADDDVVLVKIAPDTLCIQEHEQKIAVKSDLSISPNPFAHSATIAYSHQQRTKNAKLEIYDVAGMLVRQWAQETIRRSDCIIWDGTDDVGAKLPSGVYFLKFQAGEYEETKKLILLR